MSYYDEYGDDTESSESGEDISQAINYATQTIYNTGATWSDYYGKKADRQLQWDLMKYQLDYNKPSAQMARLREAGLNPYNGASISVGNMDSIPNMGDSPYSAIASGLTREAQIALQRVSSQTALKEAQLRSRQVSLDLRRLAMAEDLFPTQKRIAENNAYTGELTNEFLNSSMRDRLDELSTRVATGKLEQSLKRNYAGWMKMNWRDYYDELYKGYKQKNAYTQWLIDHGNDAFDYQKGRDKILDEHWDIINNPFGLDVGTGSVNSFLNTIFSILRLIFGK